MNILILALIAGNDSLLKEPFQEMGKGIPPI